jgi:hypothetical protein
MGPPLGVTTEFTGTPSERLVKEGILDAPAQILGKGVDKLRRMIPITDS